jgi:hypothetical protein
MTLNVVNNIFQIRFVRRQRPGVKGPVEGLWQFYDKDAKYGGNREGDA